METDECFSLFNLKKLFSYITFWRALFFRSLCEEEILSGNTALAECLYFDFRPSVLSIFLWFSSYFFTMYDGFQLVKKRRQRKKKTNFENSKVEVYESLETFKKKLKKTVEDFESSQYCFEFLQAIEDCLTSIGLNCISEILCYGIGNFLESKSSLHQLAALVKTCEKYNSSVTIYDPTFTSLEIITLKELNFKVLSDNEEGKRKIDCNQLALIYLPHCPKQLTNNFLWANWNASLSKCILIANSFSKIIQDSTVKILQESANYILKIYPKTTEVTLRDSYYIETVFNDISIHYFLPKGFEENFFIQTLEKEPEYLEDTEFIRKTETFDIKNEQQ